MQSPRGAHFSNCLQPGCNTIKRHVSHQRPCFSTGSSLHCSHKINSPSSSSRVAVVVVVTFGLADILFINSIGPIAELCRRRLKINHQPNVKSFPTTQRRCSNYYYFRLIYSKKIAWQLTDKRELLNLALANKQVYTFNKLNKISSLPEIETAFFYQNVTGHSLFDIIQEQQWRFSFYSMLLQVTKQPSNNLEHLFVRLINANKIISCN